MFRFCAADVLNWNHKNVISRCLIVSNYNCLRVRLCHAPRLGETIHHHETKGTGSFHLLSYSSMSVHCVIIYRAEFTPETCAKCCQRNISINFPKAKTTLS